MRVESISAFHVSPYGIPEIDGIQWGAIHQICLHKTDQTAQACSPDSVFVLFFGHNPIGSLFSLLLFHDHEVVVQF